MKLSDALLIACLATILVAIGGISCQRLDSASAATDVEYFLYSLSIQNGNETFLDMSERLSTTTSAYGAKVHSIHPQAMGTSYLVLLEVPKGTLQKMRGPVKK